MLRRLRAGLATCLLISSSPMLIGATDLTSSFAGRVLAAHNRERSQLGIRSLSWSPELAASAQQWASHLAATEAFKHAPEDRAKPQGENIWAGSRGYYSIESMVDAWAREKKYFKSGEFPNNSVTGDVADVGHYTQLMWRRTFAVGCAMARSPKEDILVCRYAEAGNYIGELPY